jgi:heparanase 1
LGLGAKMGLGLIMRQTFYGHDYGAIGDDLYPNPDYWLSYVYKKLVGTQVLAVNSNISLSKNDVRYSTEERIRVYAHCTKPSDQYYAGSVTVFALNMNKNVTELLTFKGSLAYQKVDVYLMTADGPEGLLSRYVALNGIRMVMIDDHTLPKIKPVQQDGSSGILLPPTSYGFFVFRSANIKACLS